MIRLIILFNLFVAIPAIANLKCQNLFQTNNTQTAVNGNEIFKMHHLILKLEKPVLKELPPEAIPFHESKSYLKNSAYIDSLDRISQWLSTKLTIERVDRIKRIFYPAGGTDGIAGLQIFPNAQEIIVLDDHPFMNKNTVSNDLKYIRATGTSWRNTNEIGHIKNISEIILGSLIQQIPNLRILSIEVYVGEKASVSGVILFDQGPNTLVRKYIHLNERIEVTQSYEELPWWNEMNINGIDALFVKGSQGLFKYHPELVNSLQGTLTQNNGILIEALSLSKSVHIGEFSNSLQDERLFDVEFGYNNGVQFIEYESPVFKK